MLARRLEAKCSLQAVQERFLGFFLDAHRAVALHVRMPAHRQQPGTGAPDVSAHHHQVGQDLHRRHGMLVLRQPHAPARDHALALGVDLGQRVDILLRYARLRDDVRPALRAQVFDKVAEANGVLAHKVHVDQARAAVPHRLVVQFGEALGHALDQGKVAAQLRLHEHRGDLGTGAGQHLHRMLRAGKTLHATFAQRIDRYDGGTAPRALA